MTDIKDAARRTMAGNLIAAAVAATVKPAKAELLAAMTTDGIEQVRVKDDAGTNYGTVSVAGDREPKAKITDERAFTAWVKRAYPGEVIEVVREAFAKKLLDEATKTGQPVAVDTSTGEVIPGVEMVTGEPYLSVRPTPLAKELMAETLAGSGLLALTAGLGSAEGDVSDEA